MGKPFNWKRRTKHCDACQRDITVKRNKAGTEIRFVKHTKATGSKTPCRNSGALA